MIGLEPVPVNPPGLDVAVYVAAAPPVAPGVYATVAKASNAKAVPIVGGCGAVVAVTADEAELAEDVPYGLVAVTVYVYEVEDDKPVTVTGLDIPVNVAGDVAGDGVTINELGAPAFVSVLNATNIFPLLYARPTGSSVAVTTDGVPAGAAIANHPDAVYISVCPNVPLL